MSLFKRSANIPEATPNQPPTDIVAAGGSLAVEAFQQDGQYSSFESVFDVHANDAAIVSNSFSEASRVVAAASFSSALRGMTTSKEDLNFTSSNNLVKARRRISEEDTDSLKMSVLSARLAAMWRAGMIDQDPEPKVYSPGFGLYIEDESEKQHLAAIVTTADLLTPEYYKAEVASGRIVGDIVKVLQTHVGSVEDFLGTIYQMCAKPTKQDVDMLRVIARNIHDVGGNNEIVDTINTVLDADNVVLSKYVDTIKYEDEQGRVAVDTFTFAQNIASSVAARPVGLDEVMSATHVSQWPKVLQDSFATFKTSYKKEVINNLRDLTADWELRSRRSPKVQELRALETYRINDSDITLADKYKKRGRASVSNDFIDTATAPELKTPKVTPMIIAKVNGSGKRQIDFVEDADVAETVVADFMSLYKPDAHMQGVYVKDIKKILNALQTNPTRVRGTTVLSDIRPYNLGATNQTMSIWRINPAHYTGLSVSELGKGLRVIYAMRNEKIAVLGVYKHDEYEDTIKNLR